MSNETDPHTTDGPRDQLPDAVADDIQTECEQILADILALKQRMADDDYTHELATLELRVAAMADQFGTDEPADDNGHATCDVTGRDRDD